MRSNGTAAVAVATSLVTLFAAGCPNGHGSGTTTIPFAQLPAQYQSTICGWEVRCGMMPDLATCAQVFDTSVLFAPINAEVAGGFVVYNGDQAAVCLGAFASLGCDRSAAMSLGATIQTACNSVFVGTVTTGGTCYASLECVPGDTCNQPVCGMMCCAGTCATGTPPPPTNVPIGGTCNGNSECVSGAYCSFGSTGGTCTADVAVGQSCAGGETCVPTAGCLTPIGGGSATCVLLVAEGSTCDPTLGFGTGNCSRFDDYCSTSTMLCTRLPGAGQPCFMSVCEIYAYCNASGTCTTLPGPGQSCSASGGRCLGAFGTSSCDPTTNVCNATPTPPVCR